MEKILNKTKWDYKEYRNPIDLIKFMNDNNITSDSCNITMSRDGWYTIFYLKEDESVYDNKVT